MDIYKTARTYIDGQTIFAGFWTASWGALLAAVAKASDRSEPLDFMSGRRTLVRPGMKV